MLSMKSIEVSKPTKWWWVRRLDIYAVITFILVPLEFSLEYFALDESLIQSILSTAVWSAPFYFYFLFFSLRRRFKYPYSVNFMEDSIELTYMSFNTEKKVRYSYADVDVFQQGKGKRERLTFARKGAFVPSGLCMNQYNCWSAEKRSEVLEVLTQKGIKVRHP